MHCAVFAVSAVANHGLALLFLPNHIDDYRRDNADQHSADYNCPDIAYDPLNHTLDSLLYFDLLCQFIRFLVRFEEHKQHTRNQEDRDN